MSLVDARLVDVRLAAPATAIVAGPTGCGKTRLLADLISMADTIAAVEPTEIVYCYGMWQDAFEEMKGVRFHRGMADVEETFPNDGANRWLIIDDLMQEASKGGELDALFTKLSHHLNITVFLVVQNFFLKSLRTVSVNSHYFFLGKNPRDTSSVLNLAKQMAPGNTARFVEAYKDATRDPYSFLFVSARQETDDAVRLLKNYGRRGKRMWAYLPSDQ